MNWNDVLNRVIWTMAEAALAVMAGATMFQDVDWAKLASIVLFAGVVTAIKCVAVAYRDKADSDILTDEELGDDVDELE